MLSEDDIEKLWHWSHYDDAPNKVRELHKQIIAELTDNVLALQSYLFIVQQQLEVSESLRNSVEKL